MISSLVGITQIWYGFPSVDRALLPHHRFVFGLVKNDSEFRQVVARLRTDNRLEFTDPTGKDDQVGATQFDKNAPK